MNIFGNEEEEQEVADTRIISNSLGIDLGTLNTVIAKPAGDKFDLYQIFTYVKNKQIEAPNSEVSGMLLYAKTDEEILPDNTYKMSGNTIGVGTLDLNQDFGLIKEQLDGIAEDYLY